MKVLITGAGGQLCGALLRTAPAHADLNAIDIDGVDFIAVEMLRFRLLLIRLHTSADDQDVAQRPSFSSLDCSATRSFLGNDPVDWRANLRLMLSKENAIG